jgi:DNA-binding NarL/FixJ family response regulator
MPRRLNLPSRPATRRMPLFCCPRTTAPKAPTRRHRCAPETRNRFHAVMQPLTEGCSVKEIARRLGLGAGAVIVHLSQAYSILGARDRAEAVLRAGLWPEQGAVN